MRENDPLSGTETRERIAENVRVELARARISASAMAQRIGVPQANFSRRMKSDVSFSADEIVAIARELGIAPGILLTVAAPLAASAA